MWALRKRFWDKIATAKFSRNKPAVIPVPRDDQRKLKAVSLADQFSGIPIPNILVADHVPDDEADKLKHAFYEFQTSMYAVFSPMEDGLPPIDGDPKKALDGAYTSSHRALFAEPVLPDEYKNKLDLGYLAVAGPYACFVEKAPEGGYQWDFRKLERYERHEGLRSLGVRVTFRVDEPGRRLQAAQIECELGTCKPGDANWGAAEKIALCAATTYVTLVRHFNWVHLAAGAPLAIATRNSLPADHPVKRLLWPHMFGTQYSNELVTKGQMIKGGDFDTIFSFTHRGMCKLMEEAYGEYDVTTLDPTLDAQRRGIKNAGFETPALDNRQAHFDVMHAHALAYLKLYYASDQQLSNDANLQSFIDQLQRIIPGGVQKLLGSAISIESAARLIAAFIYLASVEHEILGTGLWNYQMWSHIQPPRIYKNGQREPLDVYQRLVNANFNLNVSRAQLLQDFSYLAIDEKGAVAFRTFLSELRGLQTRLEQEPFAHWKIYPKILEANINA